jgi:hypothetical protein
MVAPPPEQPHGPGPVSPLAVSGDRHLRGISTVLGKFLPELNRTIEKTAEANADVLREVSGGVEASIDQVCTEISDLTAAVHDLTELVKEMAVFPRQPWSKTRRVIGWFRR